MATVDRNTGQPATTANNQSFTQGQTTSPVNTSTQGNSVAVTQGTQVQSGSSYSLNTTPQAREALNAVIQQLSDRPVIDEAQANAKFPQAKVQYTPNGWVYTNPITQLTMSATEAQNFNTLQQAKQQEFIQSGGMVAGGTIEDKAQQTARKEEITRGRATQDKYSKEAAFTDAKGLTDYFTRVLSEQQMPGILRAAEGSGASQGSTRALLTQQAIQRSSESAAKVGIDAAVSYGGINTQLAQVLEELTRSDPNGTTAQLLNALNISKGIETRGGSTQTTASNQTTTTTQTQNQQKGAENVNVDRTFKTPAPITQAAAYVDPAYTPSANAGTGYIVANTPEPYKDVSFVSYGNNDSNIIIGD